jgi:hypothetical protein
LACHFGKIAVVDIDISFGIGPFELHCQRNKNQTHCKYGQQVYGNIIDDFENFTLFFCWLDRLHALHLISEAKITTNSYFSMTIFLVSFKLFDWS